MSKDKILLNAPPFVRNILINIYGYKLAKVRFNSTFKKYHKILIDNLSKSKEEIDSEQFKFMKNTLIFAYENIEYYKKTFNENRFVPYDFDDYKQLTILPLLDKSIIRNNFSQLINKNISSGKFQKHTTSGSTGEKLTFLHPTELTFAINAAFNYRFYSLADVYPLDRRVTIGGRYFTNKPPFWAYNKFENQLLMSSHHLSSNTIQDYISKILQFKPAFIQGHPSSILFIAQYMLERNIKVNQQYKAIFTTGETLTEENKAIIEAAFNTIVLQQYGSGESCFSAQETPEKNGFMLNYEHGYVELIGEGEYKEVVATSFLNPVMPFIRYKIGDLVSPISEKVDSKWNLPFLFDKVLGRIDDMLLCTSGDKILPVTIRMQVKPYLKEFTNYQIVQNDRFDFTLNLIDENKVIDVKSIVQIIKKNIGDSIKIEVKYVDALMSKGGKIRNIINRMQK